MHNDIADFSYLKFFLYHHVSSKRDISYSGYLEISSYQLGEGQHDDVARGCSDFSACAGIFRGTGMNI